MMPLAAVATCLLVTREIGLDKIDEEVRLGGAKFVREKIFKFMIKWLCPIFCLIILVSAVANAFGVIHL